jgi:hypothetical protein
MITQNFPNPFNSSTKFSIFTENKEQIVINIYNIAGKKIKTLYRGENRGWSEYKFSGYDAYGRELPTGVYFIHVKTNQEQKIIKSIYAK